MVSSSIFSNYTFLNGVAFNKADVDFIWSNYSLPSKSRQIPLKFFDRIIYAAPFWSFGGDAKLAPLVAYSSASLQTCTTSCKGCYAKKLHGLRPHVRRKALIDTYRTLADTERLLQECIFQLVGVSFARPFISGDICKATLSFWHNCFALNPHCNFCLFSKSRYIENLQLLNNVKVHYSYGINFSKGYEQAKQDAKKNGCHFCEYSLHRDGTCGGRCRWCFLHSGKVWFQAH